MKITQILAFLSVVLTVLSTAIYLRSQDKNEIYAQTMVVAEVDYENDIVIMNDSNEHLWEFYGTEDWCVGDVVSVIMSDKNTPENIYDDEIIKVTYSSFKIQN